MTEPQDLDGAASLVEQLEVAFQVLQYELEDVP